MLQLQTKAIDICRISKILARYNIKASITDSVITLDGDVSDELLTQLCGSTCINVVRNFISKEPVCLARETSFIKSEDSAQLTIGGKPKQVEATYVEESEKVENCTQPETDEKPGQTEPTTVEETETVDTVQTQITLSHNHPEYDLIYSEVKRGQVYWCDLGEPYGHEQGGMRPVIVVQNDAWDLNSPTTIVIPCTTNHKKKIRTNLYTTFSSENMLDYDLKRVGLAKNRIDPNRIRVVNKTQLRKYIGMLTPEFLKQIDGKIDISLGLSREVKTIEKTVYVDRPVEKPAMVDSEAPERKDVNMIQVQLLSFVDINELLKISQSHSSDEVKAKKILELFGFDFKKNGVQYLLKAIITSPKNAYFNLETLSESVSRTEGIDTEEVKRLIVARVKENFGFRKAPTIDFIRLVNNFLVKQEA